MKRKPIKRELNRIVLLIAINALLLSSLAGLYTMKRIQNVSETSIIEQMKQNLDDIVAGKAEAAGVKLSRYANYVNFSADYIEKLYDNPSGYTPREVLPPYAENAGIYTLQRNITGTDVNLDDIREEMELLGNIESIWAPIMEDDGDFISTAYLGTERGFLIGYDTSSELSAAADRGEAYYNYYGSTWYSEAQGREKGAFFTEVYDDVYGRGLTVTCASPFFKNGSFAGVVCMDILVSDLQYDAIDISLGEGSRAILVDGDGCIIASPDMKPDQKELDSILSYDIFTPEVTEEILRGEEGVSEFPGEIYCAYAPVGQADWVLCVTVPREIVLSGLDSISRSIRGSEYVFGFIFLNVLAAVAVLVSKFSTKLTAPLKRLQEDVEIISKGNLDHKATVIGNDELGDLAQAFNSMTDSLKDYIAELTSVTAEKERIGAELSVASHIQSSMLPCIFPPFPDRKEFDIYASMVPAKEIGGDFYDLFMVDNTHIALVMADVSGKGVPAALFMVIGKTLIKDHTVPGTDLGEVFTSVNNMLCDSNSEGLFITAFECVLDLETGELRYVNAGHNPPLIRREGGEFEYLRTKAAFVLAGMEGIKYRSGSMTLNTGDEIFLYTDGITEACDTEEKLYGEDRLRSCLNTAEYSSCRELLSAVKEDTAGFVGDAPQFDDMTMLALKFEEKYTAE